MRSDPLAWPKYARFVPALEAALEKITEYYSYTEDSDAYTTVMCTSTVTCTHNRMSVTRHDTVLDPSSKGEHIRKHWGEDLYKTALNRLEDIVRSYPYDLPHHRLIVYLSIGTDTRLFTPTNLKALHQVPNVLIPRLAAKSLASFVNSQMMRPIPLPHKTLQPPTHLGHGYQDLMSTFGHLRRSSMGFPALSGGA